jgi:tRNA (adenine57-N1/adenine58-N1)-methyltransferase
MINEKGYESPGVSRAMNPERTRPILIMGDRGEKHLVLPGNGMKQVSGLGVVDTDRLALLPAGSRTEIAGKNFLILGATLPDLLECLKRGAQIILPKDSAQIVMACGIGPGARVLEVGTGSGALTIALAYFVGSEGKVVSYESNPKHARLARSNISLAGMDGRVEIREANAGTCADTDEYDSLVMDMPDPWNILDAVIGALKIGGFVCAYVPTMNQAETVIKAMRTGGLAGTHVLETIQRELVVGEGGTRPSFDMLGHTGYLCFGRKI